MFADCFETKKAAKWPKRIKKLTRELGAARDKDVQIEFVEGVSRGPGGERQEESAGRRAAVAAAAAGPGSSASGGRCHARQAGEGRHSWRKCTARWKRPYLSSEATTRRCPVRLSCRRRVPTFVTEKEDLMACAPVAGRSQRRRGHHLMRIAAKKLRYTLEISDRVYEGRLATSSAACKQVQSLLGDVHDCDVWVQNIDEFLEQERRRRSSISVIRPAVPSSQARLAARARRSRQASASGLRRSCWNTGKGSTRSTSGVLWRTY